MKVRYTAAGDTVEEMWKAFQTKVYPQITEDSVQYQALRQSFFSGSYAFFAAMNAASELPEEESMLWLDQRKEEIEEDARAYLKKHGIKHAKQVESYLKGFNEILRKKL